MTLAFTVGDRFLAAADEWADARTMDREAAIETKAEQALVEIEHLASGETEVAFAVDERTVHFEPSEQLRQLIEEQAAEAGLDPEQVLKLHVDLFARAFLPDDAKRPPDAVGEND